MLASGSPSVFAPLIFRASILTGVRHSFPAPAQFGVPPGFRSRIRFPFEFRRASNTWKISVVSMLSRGLSGGEPICGLNQMCFKERPVQLPHDQPCLLSPARAYPMASATPAINGTAAARVARKSARLTPKVLWNQPNEAKWQADANIQVFSDHRPITKRL